MVNDPKFNKPILTKIDVTRDLGGSFYAVGDWKAKHRQLAKELEFWFQDPFTDNGNSFDSCFQFKAPEREGKFGMNIKIYLKSLSSIQSESVQKALGMNMKGILYPNIRMGLAQKESQELGMTRIEISYSAATKDVENDLLHPLFQDYATRDINLVQTALSNIDGVIWHIPLTKLMNSFIELSRPNQLLIVQPTIAALIYAQNSKPSCFTGFFQLGQARSHFRYLDFITDQALPGPGSLIHCVIQHYGPTGPTKFLTMEKKTALAEIPGLKYRPEAIANITLPPTLDRKPLSSAAKFSIRLSKKAEADFDPRNPESED